jgi:hypothetical protein
MTTENLPSDHDLHFPDTDPPEPGDLHYVGQCEHCGVNISRYDDFDVYEFGLLHIHCSFEFNFDQYFRVMERAS